jgi:hypothetical protein
MLRLTRAVIGRQTAGLLESCVEGSQNRPDASGRERLTKPSPPHSEHVLRDFLAGHLDLVEPNLTLVDTEYHLANEQGASGSIDILARDASGDLVVIELKRLDQTARQALHELEKYVGLLASDRGIRVDRLRCLLLSTTWHELLVPFARFVSHADFHASGRLLKLGEDGYPIGSEIVELPALASGLETCPVQLNLLFGSQAARDAAKEAVADAVNDMCVEDYITVDLDYAGTNPHVIYPFSHYLVFGEFPEGLRQFVRTKFPEDCEEEPEGSPWWHEQLVQSYIVVAAHADEVEISDPGRFGSIESWDMPEVAGHGCYDDPLVWPKGELLRTLAADGETYSNPFKRRVTVSNKPSWSRMRRDLARCLEGAGQWPDVIPALLDELEQRPTAEIRIHAYVPNDILGGLERLVRTGVDNYMPHLVMAWKDGSTHALIGGKLAWDGITHVTSVDQTLGAVFEDFMDYTAAQVSGGLAEFETELCMLHGLRYDIGESTSWQSSDPVNRVELGTDGKLTRSPIDPGEPTPEDFVNAHLGYLNELAAVFEANTYRP